MKYPFRINRVKADDHIFWVAESTSLKACIGQGDTQEEALAELADNELAWLEAAQEMGYEIPDIPVEQYAVRSNKPIIVTGPVKKKHERNNHEKRVEQMMKTHCIVVKVDMNGKPTVERYRKNEEEK